MFVGEELGWFIFYGSCEETLWIGVGEKSWKKGVCGMKEECVFQEKNMFVVFL
jgi:hypothetical protein